MLSHCWEFKHWLSSPYCSHYPIGDFSMLFQHKLNYLQIQDTTCLPSPWHLNTRSQKHKASLLIFYFRPNIRNTIIVYVCFTCWIYAGRCSISITFFITIFRWPVSYIRFLHTVTYYNVLLKFTNFWRWYDTLLVIILFDFVHRLRLIKPLHFKKWPYSYIH
jgi:hypothetical protein